MKRTPIERIHLKGTPLEIAFQLGKRRKTRIQRRVDFWNREIGRLFRGKAGRRKRLEAGFLKAAQAAPRYLEEVRAMAEGADLPFEDLFRLNLTELKAYVDKCTTLVIPFTDGGRRRILLAHNEDWNPRQNDVVLLKADTPEVNYAIVAYDGYLPGLSCGVNSHGFYHAVNYLRPLDRRIGMPRIFITRHLVTARGFNDMLGWVKSHDRAFGQSIHMAKGGRYLGLELTAAKMIERRPPLPTLHANHYLSPQLRRLSPRPSESSALRQEIGAALLRREALSATGPWSAQRARAAAKAVLSDRTGFPYAIWREDDTPRDSGATLVTALMDTGKLALAAYRRPSIHSKPKTVTVSS